MSTVSHISKPAGGNGSSPASLSRRIRSSPSSRATGSASTSPRSCRPSSTPRSRRRTAARGRSPGWRSTPARSRRACTARTCGCRRRRSRRSRVLGRDQGPMTTPVGGGIRSLNVALRQKLDLYVCLRPVRYFPGVPSPLKDPSTDGHGHLPREHRGHLRRHRVGGRVGGGAPGDLVPPGRDRRAEDPVPGDLRYRHQAVSSARAPSGWCARRSSTRSTTTAAP